MTSRIFTFIELIVVCSILLILISLITPSLNKINKRAEFLQCKVHLKNIFHSVSLYLSDYNDILPGPSGFTIKPTFKRGIGTTKNGELKSSHKRLSSFLSPYINSNYLDNERNYIPSFICPSNESNSDLSSDPRERSQYNIIYKVGAIRFPFGRPKSKDEYGNIIKEIDSKSIHLIDDPSNARAFKDIRDPKQIRDDIPDLPIHENGLENIMYYNGSAESAVVNDPTTSNL